MSRRRSRFTNAHCCYCKRQLLPAKTLKGNAFTLDHVKPQSHGGWKRVPCCRDCNGLKADLDMEDWFWFIRFHPRWWKNFDTPEQVQLVVRAEYVRRGKARAAFLKDREGDKPQ